MKRLNLLALFLLLSLVPVTVPASLAAEESQRGLCHESGASEDYVRDAIVLCMQDLPSRRSDCMRDAESQFQRCEMKGNFKRISRRVQTKLIVLSIFKNFISTSDRYKVAANGQR